MRYLVFGDVHGNRWALEAVLQRGRELGAELYLFLGDLLGYGPAPLECVRLLHPLETQGELAWVAGNHELVVRGDFDATGYTAEAQATLQWTRDRVRADPVAWEFVRGAQLITKVRTGGGVVWLTHDSLADPSCGRYHRLPQNAQAELDTLAAREGRVCFYGHTHRLRVEFGRNGTVLLAMLAAHEGAGRDPRPLPLPAGELAWIGVGSVGFPTNAQRRAEFLILDDTTWMLEKYAIAYPREQAQEQTRTVLTGPCGAEVAERIARWL